jgi:hypothetical protein
VACRLIAALNRNTGIVLCVIAGILVVIGMIAALPIAVALIYLVRDLGWTLDLGLVVNALSAAGAVGAAAAALMIASRDRKDRERQRLAASEAQARLVRITVRQLSEMVPMNSGRWERLRVPVSRDWGIRLRFIITGGLIERPLPTFDIQVDNYSQQSILEVKFESGTLKLAGAQGKAAWTEHAELPVVMPRRESVTDAHGRTKFGWRSVVFLDNEYKPVITRSAPDPWPLINADRCVQIVVTFMDSDGQRWRRSTDGKVERIA